MSARRAGKRARPAPYTPSRSYHRPPASAARASTRRRLSPSRLLDGLEAGQSVIITRRGEAVAKLEPVRPARDAIGVSKTKSLSVRLSLGGHHRTSSGSCQKSPRSWATCGESASDDGWR